MSIQVGIELERNEDGWLTSKRCIFANHGVCVTHNIETLLK